MAICHWHENDRPREKLLKFGADQLSDAELLAIFLRTGVTGQSAVELAQTLLDQFQSLSSLLAASYDDFCQGRGLGQAKYVQLQAVLEMSRRHFQSGLQKGEALTEPETAAHYLQHHLTHQPRETFAVLLLDQQHRLITFDALFTGTLNQAAVHPREVIQSVLDHQAAAVILSHNHPSGDPTPSDSDHQLTQRLKTALTTIEVRCLDHIIIGDRGRWHSMAQAGQL
ncbi:MAG: DNA repair protein RadC [Hydrogenovibrio sp.]|uniref:RadC family protein n=1 Tax=Hydrogenovibrio sp. TaxID=2065821 RepID=UPI0028707FA7|nr:DNA repair protein RadC [Hydrogenovibrio sp.]MDR9499384.1 DNA repair protein RadC [Hydrogenovibrio sp.]